MGSGSRALLVAAVFTAALLWARKANAKASGNDALAFDLLPYFQPYADDEFIYQEPMKTPDYLRAFLYTIQGTEHTRSDALSGAAYFLTYGHRRFNNTADHPFNTKEWSGAPLSNSMCANAGFSPGCITTAAGAYQIIVGTWNRVRKAGAWGPYLPDFSPASQDEAARRLLIERAALGPLMDGDLRSATYLAASEWASLPGSVVRQNPKPYETVVALFNEGLQLG